MAENGTHESRSSIELTRNAKGDMQWSVKVYRDDGQEEEAVKLAIKINDDLNARYYPAVERAVDA